MVEVRVSFDKERLAVLLNALANLPAPIKPQYFGEEEKLGSQANRVDDAELFSDFVRSYPGGFFLFADEWTYQIFTAGERPARFTAYCSAPPSDAVLKRFFELMASVEVPFALAADESEYEHRNRLYQRIGENDVESWVGRDIRKYLPGLYWYTMASESLLQEHGVDITKLSANTLSSERFGKCHLFKFFERAEDWKKQAAKLDELCETTEGIFSSRQVSAEAGRARNYVEYSNIVGQWS